MATSRWTDEQLAYVNDCTACAAWTFGEGIQCTTHGDEWRNDEATDGVSRCECGCKYWKRDVCVDCNTQYDKARHDGGHDERAHLH